MVKMASSNVVDITWKWMTAVWSLLARALKMLMVIMTWCVAHAYTIAKVSAVEGIKCTASALIHGVILYVVAIKLLQEGHVVSVHVTQLT